MNINSSNDLIQTLLLLLCTWRHMYQKKMANAESWMHEKLFEIYQCRYKCHMQYLPKCLSFIPISFIVFQDNTNTQNGNKNSWRWDETRAGFFFFALENGVSFMPFSLPLKSPCSSKSIDISSRDKSNKYWRMYLCWWHNDYLPVVISSYYFSPDQWISLNCCTSCVDHILGLFVPHSSLVSVFFFSASWSLRFVRLTFFVLNLFWTVQQT